ncbi:MAG: PQQ-binding-like beta-propeller repeat protein [Pseudomonadota bacterium]|nr:PQQ-binding-like beta-propeller repeat protein [Pseudomonadota bacterium]
MRSILAVLPLLAGCCLPGGASSEPPPFGWTLVLAEEPQSAEGRGGTLFAIGETTAYAVKDGKLLWEHATAGTGGWHAFLPSGCLLIGNGDGLVCLDPASGEPRWDVSPVVTWPREESGAALTGPGNATPRGAEVYLDSSRLFVLDEAACAARAPGCLTPSSELDAWYHPSAFVVTKGGYRVIAAAKGYDRVIRVEAPDGTVRAQFAAEEPSGPTLQGDHPLILDAGRLYRMDPAACSPSAAGLAPPCATEVAVPAGSASWRDFAILPGGGAVLTNGLEVAVMGPNAWLQKPAGSIVAIAGDHERVYTTLSGGGLLGGGADPLEARSLLDGEVSWRREIEHTASAGLHSGTRAIVDGAHVYVLYERFVGELAGLGVGRP